jgi:hypothetical protein
MGSATRDLETRMRRRRVYADFDDVVVATFELATMCSLGKNRGHWPDGLLLSLTLIAQIRNALVKAAKVTGDLPTINQVATLYLEHMLGEARRREAPHDSTEQVQ